jgi:hypothetical protein
LNGYRLEWIDELPLTEYEVLIEMVQESMKASEPE